ncbi:hypothetical protein KY340_03375 [Candidatus Woesearchaeota archaeon]|nr:hypothetical protein [Candidatus Woesearchaeota archaeon]
MAKKAKKRSKATLSTVMDKLDSMDRKLSRIAKEEKTIEKEELELGKEEKLIAKGVQKLTARKYLLELVRGAAGAFLGVGIGERLLSASTRAETLSWLNIIGILLFVLVLSSLLIYKNEKDHISKRGKIFVFWRLGELYLISLAMEALGLVLFAAWPGTGELLFKALIVGSYAAMSGAVSFTILD